MSDPPPTPNQQVVPRPVRPLDERAFCFQGPDDDRAGEDLRPVRGRGRDLRALAGRGCLRARRARLDRRPGPAAVHDHPAAAERHRLAPPGPRPADGGRGPDDPPRPDARPPDALPARPRPRQHRGPVRARRHPRQGRGEPPVARSRALPRADAGVLRLDEAGDARPAAARRRLGRLGPPALHDGRGLGEGRPRRVRAALPRRPRVPHRGAGQLVPRLPDHRQRPRGHRHAGDRHALVDPLPPHRRGDRGAGPGSDDHDRDDPTRDAPRRHRGGRPPDDPRYAALVGRRCASRSSSATCRSSPTRWSTRRSGPARSRSPRPTTTTTTRPGCATACRRSRSSPTTRRSPGPGPPTTASTGSRRGAGSWPTSTPWATSWAAPPTRWSSAAASAATTSSSRGSRRSGSSAPVRWPPARSTRRGPAGRGSCRTASRRPGSTG